MVKSKTVKGWGFPCLGYECDESENVLKIFCTICREFYSTNAVSDVRGRVEDQVDKFVKGTTVVKKNNFSDHLTKSRSHQTAVIRINEKRDLNNEPSSSSRVAEAAASTSAVNNTAAKEPNQQLTILSHIRRLTGKQHETLVKKFQVAHFVAAKGKSFAFYEDLCKFEADVHHVDLGKSYFDKRSGAEMVKYLALSSRKKKITEPLNNNHLHYYSVLSDGSSSAKTMDEKELFLIKTCNSGKPCINVMSLEEVKDANAMGLKIALDKSVDKMEFSFERKNKEIGLCTDGAAVNIAYYNLVKNDLGDHYTLVLCPAHKLELAIKDAFSISALNTTSQKDLSDTYYLFKKANLKWRLMKRQASFMGCTIQRYKRESGTRWVEHQASSIKSYIHNLVILIGFLNHQISSPYNTTMRAAVPKLKGLKANICQLDHIIFLAVKYDILAIIQPVSKILQELSLLSPEFITLCSTTLTNIRRMRKLLHEKGEAAFEHTGLFPQMNKVKQSLTEEVGAQDIIPSEYQLRSNNVDQGNVFTYEGYLVKGSPQHAINRAKDEMKKILDALETALVKRFAEILENPVFKAVSTFLDTISYKFTEVDILFESVEVICNKFEGALKANGCDIEKLQNELTILHTHVVHFLSNCSSNKCWPKLFLKKESLGIANILHIAEIGIVFPLSNAEAERVYSFLWRVFSKERTSLSNTSLEDILRLRNDSDHDPQRYKHAVDLFLTVYPDGTTVRKRARRPDGHRYPSKRKLKKPSEGSSAQSILSELVPDSSESDVEPESVDDIDLDEISSDDDETDNSSSDEEY